ncbi:MAG: PAS domain-containing protein [Tepidamorphaceae bacterium]
MKQHVKAALLKNLGGQVEPLEAHAGSLMQLVLRISDCGTWRIDLAGYTCHWSPASCRLHGLDPKNCTLPLDRAIRLYHPYDAKQVARLIKEAVIERSGFRYVARVTRPDGHMRLIEAAATVELSETGKVESLFGIFRDITETCAVRDIADSRGAALRSIIRFSPAPTAMLDRNMHYLEVSKTWYEFHRLPPEKSIIGKSHYAVVPGIPARWRVEHQRALRGETIMRDNSVAAAEGKTSTNSGSIVLPWHTPSGSVGGLILMVTPRVQMQSNAAA